MGTPIGDMFRQARLAAGYTLEDVADQVGVTAGALSHIESGRRLPYPQNAVRIAEVLSLAPEDVMTALDQAHSNRRQTAAYEELTNPSRSRSARPAPAYQARSIDALFDGVEPAFLGSTVAPSNLRRNARWSDDTNERLRALESMADSASEAIRTLRGLLEDEDPAVAREARRLLRELDVRLPEE